MGTWIAQLDSRAQRDLLRRCLLLDASLISGSFASLGSCLYARVLGVPEMAELAADWARELDDSGTPWVRALRPVPLPAGLVAVRRLSGLLEGAAERLQFASGAVIEVWRARDRHGSDELTWAWCTARPPREPEAYHQLLSEKWSRVSLVREPGPPRIELPYTSEYGVHAKLSQDGETLIVYDGRSYLLLDPVTLDVRQRIETTHGVTDISVCEGAHRALLETWDGLFLWSAGELHELAIDRAGAKLSPDGNYLANGRGVLQVWSVAELLAAPQESNLNRMPAAFDPTGERLVSHHMLYHGRTGEVIAQLAPHQGRYSKVRARPFYQCTRRFIVDTLINPRFWRTETGERVQWGEVGQRTPFGPRSLLAYDEEGTLAAELRSRRLVYVYPLPFDGNCRRIEFKTRDALCFALSRDGTRIALATDSSIEVRDLQGALIRLWFWGEQVSHEQPSFDEPAEGLRFSRDGRRLACRVDHDHWRVWTIEDVENVGDEDGHPSVVDAGVELAAGASPDSLPDFAPPSPADWQITSDLASVFTHQPSGTRVAFPASGPWIHHPHQPQISAASHAHVELRPGRS